MDVSYWQALYADYVTAASKTGQTWTKEMLLVAMACAEHETNNGRAWPHTNNFGAVQLRSCNPDELGRISAGTLKAGDTFPSPAPGHPGGVLHIDTHPVKGGSIPYPVWFVYFGDDRVAGIQYFLQVLWRLSAGCLAVEATCNCSDCATQMYCHHYFEGFVQDDRPFQAVRALPLSTNEQKDVDAYAGAMQACWNIITTAIGSEDGPLSDVEPAKAT